MFDLIVRLSRYIFIFCIIFFLWQGVLYIADERKIWKSKNNRMIMNQRLSIVFMHILAFLILSYIPNTYTFNTVNLIIGGLGLALFVLANWGLEKVYPGSCPLIWNGVFFLMDVGLIMLVRLGSLPKIGEALGQKQLIWYTIGFISIFLIPLGLKIIPRFEKLEYLYLFGGLALLIAPFLLGEELFGALNWIQIGLISFQPSEIVKFLFIFYLATVFRKNLSFKELIFPSAMAALYVLILVFQKDLGGALIFFMTYLVMLYVSTGKTYLVISALVAASIGSVIAYDKFAHVRTRVKIWLDPWVDVYGSSAQIIQSLFAIGTWGLFGSGLTKGFPGYVPVVARDLIFAAICEEMGSIFGMGLIGVYIMIFYRGVHIALRCKRRYYSLLAVGFTAMMAFQTFLIIGGTIKLIPLTGVTMPFVSYGGSSVLVSAMMIGILQWVFMYYSEERDLLGDIDA